MAPAAGTGETGPRIALLSYSTKPRGGVVHTLSLAEAMHDAGMQVQIVSLGDAEKGFFRPVRAPWHLIPEPMHHDTLEKRVFASIDALEAGLATIAESFDVLHTQDCISARAAARVRDAGADVSVVRTVHHVDDFTSDVLVNCQRQAILEPDSLVVVSRDWQRRLADDPGVETTVIHNGVEAGRFPPIDPARRAELRAENGLTDRFVFLTVGGIEPRKGSIHLLRALGDVVARARARQTPPPALVIVGGHSFQDYRAYREAAIGELASLGLMLGRDVILTGTVSDQLLHEWYRSADALAFPSEKEGWGLAVLEAMTADLPVLVSDIPVFHEYLTDDRTCVMTKVRDVSSLAEGLTRLVEDEALRARLITGGRELIPRFSWQRAAREHAALYATLPVAAPSST